MCLDFYPTSPCSEKSNFALKESNPNSTHFLMQDDSHFVWKVVNLVEFCFLNVQLSTKNKKLAELGFFNMKQLTSHLIQRNNY